MADRKPGRLVHRVSATIEKAVPLKVTGITFKVTRKWKRSKDQRVGELIVNAGGIRWRGTRRWYSKRLTWEEVRGLFEDGRRKEEGRPPDSARRRRARRRISRVPRRPRRRARGARR